MTAVTQTLDLKANVIIKRLSSLNYANLSNRLVLRRGDCPAEVPPHSLKAQDCQEDMAYAKETSYR